MDASLIYQNLAVIAACLQDARISLREMVFTPAEHRFAAAFKRYRRERLPSWSDCEGLTECLAALVFDAIDEVIADPRGVLIYHFAFGWPPGVEVLRRARCRRVVRYHNVTPPEFFAPWSDEYERSCRAGRDEIATIAALGCESYLCDSPFNADDFLAAGVPRERIAVLAPFNRLDRLVETQAALPDRKSVV